MRAQGIFLLFFFSSPKVGCVFTKVCGGSSCFESLWEDETEESF